MALEPQVFGEHPAKVIAVIIIDDDRTLDRSAGAERYALFTLAQLGGRLGAACEAWRERLLAAQARLEAERTKFLAGPPGVRVNEIVAAASRGAWVT